MTLSVRIGGVWKAATPWVKVGGTWKKCNAVFVRVAGVWKQVYSSVASLFVVSPLGSVINDQDLPVGSNGVSQILVRSDGVIQGNGSLTGPTQWLNTTGTGNGTGFWVRCTVVSGAVNGSSDATGVWLALSATRQWQKSTGTNGGGSVQLTMEFSTDSAGSSIVCTSTNWRLAYSHS